MHIYNVSLKIPGLYPFSGLFTWELKDLDTVGFLVYPGLDVINTSLAKNIYRLNKELGLKGKAPHWILCVFYHKQLWAPPTTFLILLKHYEVRWMITSINLT